MTILVKSAELHRIRVSARIPGSAVSAREDELKRIEDALVKLIEARQKMAEVAVEFGWPLPI